MIDVALVTCADLPNLPQEEYPLVIALQARGASVEPVVWEDPAVNWANFRTAVIRATWDYDTRRDAFLGWAEWAAANTNLQNPLPVVRWNSDKIYLRELESKGIEIVETTWVDAGYECGGVTPDLAELMASRGWSEVIVKPRVGAGARGSMRVGGSTIGKSGDLDQVIDSPPSNRAIGAIIRDGRGGARSVEAGQTHLARMAAREPMMIQPFLGEVVSEGELSFIFIAGRFSHAIRKRPRAGDYRSQEEFESEITGFAPHPAEIDWAGSVLAAAGSIVDCDFLYARVDAIPLPRPDAGGPHQLRLIELELVEPSLYYNLGEGSARNLAEAIEF